ncbi:hypothetical protein PM082_006814 [Marasmius tenuissimus]|nr:hypothetical protein PM082_006814 [Marasmius tenuissimus]
MEGNNYEGQGSRLAYIEHRSTRSTSIYPNLSGVSSVAHCTRPLGAEQMGINLVWILGIPLVSSFNKILRWLGYGEQNRNICLVICYPPGGLWDLSVDIFSRLSLIMHPFGRYIEGNGGSTA